MRRWLAHVATRFAVWARGGVDYELILATLVTEVIAYDAQLDRKELAPTGDDYNEIYSLVATAAHAAGFAKDGE